MKQGHTVHKTALELRKSCRETYKDLHRDGQKRDTRTKRQADQQQKKKVSQYSQISRTKR